MQSVQQVIEGEGEQGKRAVIIRTAGSPAGGQEQIGNEAGLFNKRVVDDINDIVIDKIPEEAVKISSQA